MKPDRQWRNIKGDIYQLVEAIPCFCLVEWGRQWVGFLAEAVGEDGEIIAEGEISQWSIEDVEYICRPPKFPENRL